MATKYDLHYLAAQIDDACEKRDQANLVHLVGVCETILNEGNGTDRVDLHYFVSNSYSSLWEIRSELEGPWAWNAHEIISGILALRKAIAEPDFVHSPLIRRCQIRTNLANKLSMLGRSVEAIEEYSAVVALDPNFAMALGNRALATVTYSRNLYDPGHRCLLLNCAASDYDKALSPDAYWDSDFGPDVADHFQIDDTRIRKFLDSVGFDSNVDLGSFTMGETLQEIEYRQWCLSHCLFLNSINDVMREPIAAYDVLHLPSHSYKFGDQVRFPAFFNILKQEYVSARYNLFKSGIWDEAHVSDRDVLLIDSFDYGSFNYRTEQLKSAFLSAYAIFDKIALFLNEYFEVGLAEKQVSFRGIWERQVKGGSVELRDAFEGSKNLPLRGLYFLSKDFFDENFVEFASPDARGLASLRNFAEHRYLTLVEMGAPQVSDESHLRLSREDFSNRTLRLLKMTRAGLIYLSAAMHRQEEMKEDSKADSDGAFVIQFPVVPIVR